MALQNRELSELLCVAAEHPSHTDQRFQIGSRKVFAKRKTRRRAGKCLANTTTEVMVTLQRPPLNKLSPTETNYLRFRLSPDVTIAIGARIKRAGEEMISEPAELKVVHHPNGDETDAYERLLGDAMAGDSTLFAREDGVEAAWAIVQPILEGASPVREYEPGTWGPREANRLTADIGGWHFPAVPGS